MKVCVRVRVRVRVRVQVRLEGGRGGEGVGRGRTRHGVAAFLRGYPAPSAAEGIHNRRAVRKGPIHAAALVSLQGRHWPPSPSRDVNTPLQNENGCSPAS